MLFFFSSFLKATLIIRYTILDIAFMILNKFFYVRFNPSLGKSIISACVTKENQIKIK